MKRQIHAAICCLLVASFALPVQATQPPVHIVTDHALQVGGVLEGQVVLPTGEPVAGAPVLLANGDTLAATAVTDQQGQFRFEGLRGGVYQVQAAGSNSVRRLWTANAAPPAATHGEMVIRGQSDYPAFRLISPYTATWVALGLGVGALVWLAVDDDDAS